MVILGWTLGHLFSSYGIEVDPEKFKAVIEMSPPRTLKQIKSFLVRLGYMRRFITDFALKAKPLTNMLKKDVPFLWIEGVKGDFDDLKYVMTSGPVLMPPSFEKPFFLYISATDFSLGGMLSQLDNDTKDREIYFISRTLIRYELNYTPIEKLCLSLIFTTKKLRHYLLNNQINVLTQSDLV